MERVSVQYGKKSNILLICPHGFDDTNTDIMTEVATTTCDGNSVINQAWERAPKVDVDKDKANCNSIVHCQEYVVKDEFYDPIFKICSRHYKKGQVTPYRQPINVGPMYVFAIHGFGNLPPEAKKKNLHLIIGWGDGKPQRATCSGWRKDRFTHMAAQYTASPKGTPWNVAIADKGSRYAAFGKDNLLQAFRSFYKTKNVHAMQLEFYSSVRNTKKKAEESGRHLGNLIKKFVSEMENHQANNSKWSVPADFKPLMITT